MFCPVLALVSKKEKPKVFAYSFPSFNSTSLFKQSQLFPTKITLALPQPLLEIIPLQLSKLSKLSLIAQLYSKIIAWALP
jgi:hypothetical protein